MGIAAGSRPGPDETARGESARPGASRDEPAQAEPGFYVYVLSCADGTLYTGYTNDVAQRVRAHNAGKGAKYTRGRAPLEVVAQARFVTKREAMSAEFRFKRLSRAAKDRLLARARSEGFAAVLAALHDGKDIDDAAAGATSDAAAGAVDAAEADVGCGAVVGHASVS